jgi:hypothetical protein
MTHIRWDRTNETGTGAAHHLGARFGPESTVASIRIAELDERQLATALGD